MKALSSTLILTLPALLAGCLSGSKPADTVEVKTTDPTDYTGFATIVETVGSGGYHTSAQTFAAAGMVEMLTGDGPYTVFVVRDEAAGAMAPEQLAAGSSAFDLDGLAGYHVIEGRHSIKELMNSPTMETVGGQRLTFSHWNGEVEIAGCGNADFGVGSARVVEGDLQCSNGVIHVIDQVLFPSFDSLADQIEGTESFKTLVNAAQAAGVLDLLDSDGPFTVFAPTDRAFANFDRSAVSYFMAPENRAELVRLLQHHVVQGRYYGDTMHHQPLTTLGGDTLQVKWQSGAAYIGNAEVIASDFQATNGVLHVVDTVLMPTN
ncbi:fasciclin domain-containing protein [Engelhardtia mirabilis]|uniref:Immunogenic protein MPT70 n=1 Tax=Engelhardtia mirabilis TaxID=2528011 RepID=A0A518BG69_9BACT|nr:Immunogenic protein MPT70 precursor [Planctomycetes bacterium Pla133]QDV00303.1 Immunogenic protein MPT70 precursor [Planctomycetes bacterium Pla86]